MRFDDALSAMVAQVGERFPEGAPAGTTIVRDAVGLLTLVLPDEALPSEAWSPLAATLDASLERFSPGNRRVLLRASDLVDPIDVLDSRDRALLPDAPGIALVDRLLTNQDWLREPRTARPPIPTATFFSIKGGVGRSTAASVLAWHLARKGQRVLVVDLDLEAPGIGGMLLSDLPDYGAVDWCVESLAGAADAALFEQMLAPSPLAESTSGDIRVIPVYGRRTNDYVAKVGRAYMPSFGIDATQLGLADRLLALLQTAADRVEPPDVVLLDARAGLHDIGSAAVTQLGAEVFLFARSDEQGRDGYARLFEHLRRARSVHFGMPEDDLRWRLKMVAAQIEPTVGAFETAIESAYEIWTAFYDDGEINGAIEFSREDESAPHYPIPVTFDPRVRAFDFLAPDRRPTLDLVDSVFGRFVAVAAERLESERGSEAAAAEVAS
ncbi:P-loop NTPase [Sorangium sp. So ce216]